MSAGETGGEDLMVETLEFIDTHWDTVAGTFDEADVGGGDVWQKPILRNGDLKTLYPSGQTSGYTQQLRNNDVVTVLDGGRVDDVTGTEFDFDVAWDVDVRCEALPNNGFSVIGDSTDWQVFIHIVRRSILTERHKPITDPNCKFDWRWITTVDQSTLPETEDSRDHLGKEIGFRWHGYERLPSL